MTIARHLHELCDDVGLANFVKTSGSTGLHVLIPLGARYTYEQSRTLAELLARFTAKSLPDIATIVRAGSATATARSIVDYLQNGHGRLLVSPFSVRPLPGAPVSMPLDVAGDQRPLDARALQYPLGRQVAREARRPARDVLTASSDMLAALESADAPARRLTWDV